MLTRLEARPVKRILGCFSGQKGSVQICPDLPVLKGKTALVTGPTSGIGRETVAGLLARGAHVVLAGRSCKKLRTLIDGLAEDGYDTGTLMPVICDLADLDSVAVAVQEINKLLRMKPLDILIENAGIMPVKYSETPQGHEISFGTNVLGHFALRAGLLRGCLSEKARVIILTGDVYVFRTAVPSISAGARRLAASRLIIAANSEISGWRANCNGVTRASMCLLCTRELSRPILVPAARLQGR